jgi:ribonucleoside-diphosphate reductase alpha chain
MASDMRWMMDALMLGVGVGFKPVKEQIFFNDPTCWEGEPDVVLIEDSREGWVDSVQRLIETYVFTEVPVEFDYSLIRPYGADIKTFGGKASGPEPLMQLHKQIREFFKMYQNGDCGVVELKTNIANCIGVCVIAGNVRRSAELALNPITCEEFLDLKDYEKYPHRKMYGYMSNNTVTLQDNTDFLMLGEIADRVKELGEPGIANLRNFPLGRVGKDQDKALYRLRDDKATGLNPCGEITLEHKELCNIAETLPTMCENYQDWLKACKHATIYCSTVSLLPTHDPSTNVVMMRNRRIGVSIIDYRNWVKKYGQHNVVRYLNLGYDLIRKVNSQWNGEAGVPDAIKVTTIKPGGTGPKLPGKVSGMSAPTFNYTRRRIDVAANSPIVPILQAAGVPWEAKSYDPRTLSFSFPIYQEGTPAKRVSLWEQALDLLTMQRHWADNAVSNTLYFQPKWVLVQEVKDETEFTKTLHNCGLFEYGENSMWKVVKGNIWGSESVFVYKFNENHEEDIIEPVLSHIAPHIKSCSLLPHTAEGVYDYMPESELSEQEYFTMLNGIKEIDWSLLQNSDGSDEKYCQGPTCTV